MNKLTVLALVMCFLSIQSCKKDANEQTSDSTTTTTTTTTPEDVNSSPPTTTAGTYASPVLPDRNSEKVQLLLRTYWVAEFWVNHRDNSQNKSNKGRWWKFEPDGMFTTGQWEETYSSGSWAVYNDGDRQLLHMDAANDELDMEFQMQAVSNLKDYMSWAGTKTYGQSSIAVKSVSLLSMPTKAQFNVKD